MVDGTVQVQLLSTTVSACLDDRRDDIGCHFMCEGDMVRWLGPTAA